MNKNDLDQIYDRLNNSVEYILREYDICIHELCGILEHIKYDLFSNNSEE